MSDIKTVCVYCGSRCPTEAYRKAAYETGKNIAQAGMNLVYGGSRSGLMGVVADAVLKYGGEATGVIPHHIQEQEDPHNELTETIMVDTMHERKQVMVDRSDAFITLCGGFGTLDETFEILTWKQLELHDKPIILVNIEGYWAPFMDLVNHVVDEGLAESKHLKLFEVIKDPSQLITALKRQPEPVRATQTKYM